jgi:hypothetical protein
LLKALEWGDWKPGPVPGRGGEILLAHVYRNEGKRRCGLLPSLVLFRLVPLSSPARSGGAISGTGCVVPQPFAA